MSLAEILAQPERQELVVSGYGVSLGKQSERVVIRERGRVLEELPYSRVSQILITGRGISVSSDLIKDCSLSGIPISFMAWSGEPYAIIVTPHLQGTVQTRRQQLVAYTDDRGSSFARAICVGKIRNQANFLKYLGKYRKKINPDVYLALEEATGGLEDLAEEAGRVRAANVDEARPALLNLEGRASAIYWQTISSVLPPEAEFPGRLHQGASDLVNSLLNYGYGVLYSQTWTAATLAGLDPYAGFLHVDRPGKPSLILDLVEEFRQTVVDRVVLGLVDRGVRYEIVDGRLDDESRKNFAQKILKRLATKHRYERKSYELRTIIHRQARRAAVHFRGEKKYSPFVASW